MRNYYIVSIFATIGFLSTAVYAEDGYDLWLRYRSIEDVQKRQTYSEQCRAIVRPQDSSTLRAAAEELQQGIKGLTGHMPDVIREINNDGSLVLLSAAHPVDPDMADLKSELQNLPEDGYVLQSKTINDRSCILIGSKTDAGVLYGSFALLRRLQTNQTIKQLDLKVSPDVNLRLANHWDNLDGGVERGYAGRSIFHWDQLPQLNQRYTDYARMLASIGINGTAINNVNVKQKNQPGWYLLKPKWIEKLAALAGALRPYRVKLYISVGWNSPMHLGGLETADPLDPDVRQWWSDKADELYKAIPDFGGFLVKADSEGQPGPYKYGRNHADGANMLADALRPHGGMVIWRAFVYGHKKTDRACQAWDNFKPLDGQFADNVAVQIKNGPIDFQVREPVSPLFGTMPQTNEVLELQVTQEYTGFSTHLCFLVPQWKEVLEFDTYAKGENSPVKRIVDGTLFNQQNCGMAGVMNIGMDRNWTGHHLAAANTYGYGRLAWDPDLNAKTIAEQWTRMTFGNDPQVVKTVTDMLMRSWEIYENYTSPLGVGVICAGNHYDPAPQMRRYYHRADKNGVGFDRTIKSGSGFTAQYHDPVTTKFESPETCPEELLLFFHHVPYTCRLDSGKTVIQHIYDSHYRGVEQARGLREDWKTLKGRIDAERYAHVLDRLNKQIEHAKKWRDAINQYFHKLSGIPDEKGRF
jgi:alpha-glucuronidase